MRKGNLSSLLAAMLSLVNTLANRIIGDMGQVFMNVVWVHTALVY
jgi:hypothetical protein